MKAAAVFKDGMILQRQKPVRIWGTGIPREQIAITVEEPAANAVMMRASATVREDCTWEVQLEPMEAARNLILRIASEKEQIRIRDVAVGEVWIAGGQSNMEFPMCYEKHYQEALKNCENSDIRFYDVPEISYEGNLEEFDYSFTEVWRKAGKSDLGYFSAVGYYFQKELQECLQVPVGIIGCNWGGTNTSVWAAPETVAREGRPWLARLDERTRDLDMESWWKSQPGNPVNAHGRPCMDPFSAFMLPENRTVEEMQAFIETLAEKGAAPEEGGALHPQDLPGSLYEYMVKRIAPYTVRGILWYQGESDDGPDTAPVHGRMLKGLICDWRALWGEVLPFLGVQLPGFRDWVGLAALEYPELRRQQEWAIREVGNAWLCSISDGGEETDIHPKDKKIVGERLSLLARGHVYGERELLCDAPEAKCAVREKQQIRIFFYHAEGGLQVEGGTLQGMEVLSDGKAVQTEAVAEGDVLLLNCLEPLGTDVDVLFAQTGYYKVNLYNQSHIPAKPFRFLKV